MLGGLPEAHIESMEIPVLGDYLANLATSGNISELQTISRMKYIVDGGWDSMVDHYIARAMSGPLISA